MLKYYEFFDVTADIGFYAYGKSINQAFENAALAMFNIITDTQDVYPVEEYNFSIHSEDKISLLYDFLEELLFLHETEFMLFSKFHIKINDDLNLNAVVKGEKIDWLKHKRGSEIKAITFHKMDIQNTSDGFKIQAIVDL